MGYWHTGNPNVEIPSATKTRDTLICTDKCTMASCGNTALRFDHSNRFPIVDFAASDSLLGANDYTYFPGCFHWTKFY